MPEWVCYYCDQGMVKTLPSKCPKCGHELKKPVNELTKEEFTKAFMEKAYQSLPVYSLAV